MSLSAALVTSLIQDTQKNLGEETNQSTPATNSSKDSNLNLCEICDAENCKSNWCEDDIRAHEEEMERLEERAQYWADF